MDLSPTDRSEATCARYRLAEHRATQENNRGIDMKVIAIMGSPKGKGSGYKVVKKIEEKMKTLGDTEFEYLFLKDANIQLCKGCFACIGKGADKCPLKDDLASVEKKMLEADGIILSSPAYVFNVSWLMKNFIDRFAYANHRPRFFRQKVLTVVNTGGIGQKEALYSLKYALGGARIVHELGVVTPPWPEKEKAVEKRERAIAQAAENFYRACLDKNMHSPRINEYLGFMIMKHLATEIPDYLAADREYYADKEYYYDVKISLLTKLAAGTMFQIALLMMKDVGVGNVKWPKNEIKAEHV
jgi:multimeric flavodoxin WrbA